MIRVKIEIPKNSNLKYEFNKHRQVVQLDRIVAMEYPFNYGFVTETLWDDGDALDAFVLGNFCLHPGVEVEVEPVAVIKMHDRKVSDFKLVCCLPGYGDDLTSITRDVKLIKNFLKKYKPGTEVKGSSFSARTISDAIHRAEMQYEQSLSRFL